MTSGPVKVGIVGCGNISSIYFKNLTQVFQNIEVKAAADLDVARAEAQAKEFGVPIACSVQDLMADPEIEIVVNLTIPQAHHEVAMKAIAAGKSVHGEKPLTVTRAEGQELLAAAKEKGVLVGAAPDTFCGAGIQTCLKLIEDGAIGTPVAANAFMMCHGHESWHPAPEFYYKVGGGPMFDMGPYYLTALVGLLGPVERVTGASRASFPTRTITSEPKNGTIIDVEVPTHIAGVMNFKDGAIGTIITSFDVWAHALPRIEVHGSEGSLLVPDPNSFGGPVKMKNPGDEDWQDIALTHAHEENSRGIGVADMAAALRSGRSHRASGELAYHVLDLMHAFHDASDQGRHIMLESTCQRPQALPTSLKTGEID